MKLSNQPSFTGGFPHHYPRYTHHHHQQQQQQQQQQRSVVSDQCSSTVYSRHLLGDSPLPEKNLQSPKRLPNCVLNLFGETTN